MIVSLALLSLAFLRLVPEQSATLAELTPSSPLFYFEMYPHSLNFQKSGERVLAQLGEEPERISKAMEKLPEQERQLASRLLADPETRVAVSAFNFKSHPPDRIRFDFLVLSRTSAAKFSELAALANRWIAQAIPPAHYIEMQQNPRLGVFLGEPPKRLYVYQEYPDYALSNSPDLITRLLEIRYKGHPPLARQNDFQKMEQAIGSPEGALLYVSLAGLVKQPDAASAAPIVSVLQALRISEWRSVGYHWSEVQGQLVERTILIEAK